MGPQNWVPILGCLLSVKMSVFSLILAIINVLRVKAIFTNLDKYRKQYEKSHLVQHVHQTFGLPAVVCLSIC